MMTSRLKSASNAIADYVLVGHVLTMDHQCPTADVVAVRGERILWVGQAAETRRLCGPRTKIIDTHGRLILPGFHDAHIHLLKLARARGKVDCSQISGMVELQTLLRERARTLPPGAWLRTTGYDEHLLGGRHANRHDLDAALPDRPVRLEHRALHLDILNTAALAAVGDKSSRVECNAGGQPTGRVYYGGAWLNQHMSRPSRADMAADVRAATEQLLSAGITCVTDASVTNGPDHLTLFEELAASRDLGVRVFMMPGAEHASEMPPPGRGAVRLGPAKVLLDEATANPDQLRDLADNARAHGFRLAVHAATEAELVLALSILQPGDRVEHGAVIPDDMLADIRDKGVTIVGQPALVYDRGDYYLGDHPSDQHGWLHRARTLVDNGIPYAIGSDAPVGPFSPETARLGATRRLTRGGQILGEDERLSPHQALEAMTLQPARAVQAEHELGILRPGALADITVLDPDFLDAASAEPRKARLTMVGGRILWRDKVEA
jgi:predicted amidohydrolase YtcJ